MIDRRSLAIAIALISLLPGSAGAQARGARGGTGSARAEAPIDLTGQWVAVISEDWRWRMITPPKGDIVSIPLSLRGQQVAEAWDPAKDEAAGEQCKAYGAPGLMRGPIRMRISWQDDTTLKVETDYGIQTRICASLRLRSGKRSRPLQLHAAGRATHLRSGWCEAAAAAHSVTARSRR